MVNCTCLVGFIKLQTLFVKKQLKHGLHSYQKKNVNIIIPRMFLYFLVKSKPYLYTHFSGKVWISCLDQSNVLSISIIINVLQTLENVQASLTVLVGV